jgi:predicted TIM-barrel fold metal-dependent hydrolase
MSMNGAVTRPNDLPLIVSVDDHVIEPPTLWTDRLSTKDQQHGPRVVRDSVEVIYPAGSFDPEYRKGGHGPAVDWWLYEDLVKPVPQPYACVGIPPEQWKRDPISYSEMRPGCYEPGARLADMTMNHTERSLCFPSISRFCGQMFLEAKDRDVALRCVQAYNDWMIDEWCGDSLGRLIPLCLIPLWDPRFAAAEIYRNAARGARAITFPELPSNLGLPSIHDRERYWDPVFAACEDTHTVICMHIGSGSTMPITSSDAPAALMMALCSINAEMSLADWLVSGVFGRYPDLSIAYSEGQAGWMPYLLERLDRLYARASSLAKFPAELVEPPSAYFGRHVYACIFEDMFALASHEHIGLDRLTFETDYPHQDGTWPNSRAVVEEMATILSQEDLTMVVRGNALRMLGIAEAEVDDDGTSSTGGQF